MDSIWQMDGKGIVRAAFYLQENKPAPVFLCEWATGERTWVSADGVLVTNLYMINWLFRNPCIMSEPVFSKILTQQAKDAPNFQAFLDELKYRSSPKANSKLEYKPLKKKYQFRMAKRQ